MNILGFTRNTRKIGDFLLSLKEIVETGIGRPHPYDMPINLGLHRRRPWPSRRP